MLALLQKLFTAEEQSPAVRNAAIALISVAATVIIAVLRAQGVA